MENKNYFNVGDMVLLTDWTQKSPTGIITSIQTGKASRYYTPNSLIIDVFVPNDGNTYVYHGDSEIKWLDKIDE
jgi:hypothetical protein